MKRKEQRPIKTPKSSSNIIWVLWLSEIKHYLTCLQRQRTALKACYFPAVCKGEHFQQSFNVTKLGIDLHLEIWSVYLWVEFKIDTLQQPTNLTKLLLVLFHLCDLSLKTVKPHKILTIYLWPLCNDYTCFFAFNCPLLLYVRITLLAISKTCHSYK